MTVRVKVPNPGYARAKKYEKNALVAANVTYTRCCFQSSSVDITNATFAGYGICQYREKYQRPLS